VTGSWGHFRCFWTVLLALNGYEFFAAFGRMEEGTKAMSDNAAGDKKRRVRGLPVGYLIVFTLSGAFVAAQLVEGAQTSLAAQNAWKGPTNSADGGEARA
jgi:hypothetical protein